MRHTKIKNVMSSPVITARESTPYRSLVELLQTHQIGFVPIVNDTDELVGVVSETDLLFKEANPHAEPRGPLWERRRRRIQREKAVGSVASELMTTPPQTIESWASVSRAAYLMQEHQITHLVVVDKSGKLVGVVSRGDVLRVFLRPDGQIEQEILQDVLRRELLLNPWDFQVQVRDGEVNLGGHVDRRSIALMVVNAVQGVEGVTRLNSNLTWRLDDVEYRGSSPYAISGL